jgi:hypothetical protein
MHLADQRLSDSLHNLQIMQVHGGFTIPSPHNVHESLSVESVISSPEYQLNLFCIALYFIVSFQ